MSRRKPQRANIALFFHVKTKDVKKNDIINVGSVPMKVLSNRKNHLGNRVLMCIVHGGSFAPTTLILDKNIKVRVHAHKTSVIKKK